MAKQWLRGWMLRSFGIFKTDRLLLD